MAAKIFWITVAVLGVAKCEPPSTSYGTPLAPPLTNYGTPNYEGNSGNGNYNNNNNNNNYNDYNNGNNNGGHGDHGDHGDQGEPKSYEFGYQVKDDYTGNNYNRKEASDGNQVKGEYRVLLPDGRTQIVTYYADWQSGFHADVKYEGTAQYPDQYNNNNNNNYNNNNNNGGYNYPQNNGYNNGNSGSSSVSSHKDFSSTNNNNNGYNYNNNNNNNAGYNSGSGYDSYSGNFGNKDRPSYEYGAP